ncbi:MarR family transcriptional regulator [Leptospira wolffii]|uniref:MarR family transcriptional regulator n=1 Tax=Leptospira wolffii TaxID=409998 RepID=A0A2M9ZAE1_9LEPT|nr:MarR family transcriptional regulator [Leptospira wolffii]PJZ65373.1 MarR family transcriptional regulator [Leptospira wolffii]TGK64749.1 MarR family transcriptional regulator [Leptospira wolffii]TGK76852.1 MarR family transcriptional regulator [Leptospira wolffii]TGK77296.1 MarR family transcriptional regulator [Leptospira wolffii]TGL26691.1 MarR family transcriptional regulator [Leptospira wolffii]
MFRLDDQIGFNVYRVALLFRRELLRALKEYDLTPEQWQILATLWEQGSLNQTEIIALTLQDAPSASRTVARLQKKKLVTKTPSKEDKRATIVKLTKYGESLQEEIPSVLLGYFKPYFNVVSSADQKELLRILKEFRTAFGDR